MRSLTRWSSGLPWKPHQRGLAEHWAQRLEWSSEDRDWPSFLALMTALPDFGHTVFSWQHRKDLWAEVLHSLVDEEDSPLSLQFPLDSLSEIPTLLFTGEQAPLVQTLVKGDVLIAFHKSAAREKGLAKAFQEINERHPAWGTPAADHTAPGYNTLNEEQKQAIDVALRSAFLVLTGGPGTGKTTTIFQILLQLFQAYPQIRPAVVAPTGRAASRIQESLTKSSESALKSPVSKKQQDALERIESLKPTTIHRLLGAQGDGYPFVFDLDRPLPFDLVLLDEASMVDLRLMHGLIQALPLHAALFLVGDPHQLPSVESGSILAPILGSGVAEKNVVRLQANQRIAAHDRVLDELFKTVVHFSAHTIDAFEKATREHPETFSWTFSDEENSELADRVISDWIDEQPDGWRHDWVNSCELSNLPEEEMNKRIVQRMKFVQDQIVLSPLRGGPLGTLGLGDRISAALQQKPGVPYAGLPWLVTRNLRNFDLSNGDRGLIFVIDGKRFVAFGEASGNYRRFPFALLANDGEPSWSMTIHKSQGSEYKTVFVVLPERSEKVLSRELVYTGLTRARNRVKLFSSKRTMFEALAKPFSRFSGLENYLLS